MPPVGLLAHPKTRPARSVTNDDRRRSALVALNVVVTALAAVNLLDLVRDAIFSGAPFPGWPFLGELLATGSLGLAPWLICPAVLIGLLSLALSVTQESPTGAEVLVIIPCLIALAVKTLGWQLWVTTGIYAVWSTTIGIVFNNNAGWFYGVTVVLGLLLGLVARHFIVDRTQTKQQIVALRATQNRLLEERKQLAREMHDGVAHGLAIIAGQSMTYGNDDNIEQVRAALMRTGEASRSVLEELRSLMSVLRAAPETKDLFTYDPAADIIAPLRLKQTASQIDAELSAAGFTSAMRITPEAYGLTSTTQTTVSRIIQESATNIMRYAEPASACRFIVISADNGVRVMITSDLRTTPASKTDLTSQSTGWGLRGVLERVELVGGYSHCGPCDGKWLVDATLPRYQ